MKILRLSMIFYLVFNVMHGLSFLFPDMVGVFPRIERLKYGGSLN